jgi:hypothetical protein
MKAADSRRQHVFIERREPPLRPTDDMAWTLCAAPE